MTRRLISGIAAGGTIAVALASTPVQAAEQAVVAATTYTGTSVSTPFGPAQVAVTVRRGKVTKLTAVNYPSADRRSSSINAYAIPQLQAALVQAGVTSRSGAA